MVCQEVFCTFVYTFIFTLFFLMITKQTNKQQQKKYCTEKDEQSFVQI